MHRTCHKVVVRVQKLQWDITQGSLGKKPWPVYSHGLASHAGCILSVESKNHSWQLKLISSGKSIDISVLQPAESLMIEGTTLRPAGNTSGSTFVQRLPAGLYKRPTGRTIYEMPKNGKRNMQLINVETE